MRRILIGSVAVAAVAGVVVARRRRSGPARRPDRWHAVTINRSPEEVGALPAPLDELGTAIEVRVQPAPGGRGTEVAAKLRDGVTGMTDDDLRNLRRSLREAKQRIEIGEVVLPNTPPTTERTLLSRPIEYATRHGREDGRL